MTRSGFTFFKPYILNYFEPDCRYTNATTEGLNNLIGTINISGNGYRFKHLRAKALYASLIHERTVYSVDIKTISSWKPTMNYQTGGRYGGPEIVKITKFSFHRRTRPYSRSPINLLKSNRYFPRLLDAPEVTQAEMLSELEENERTIEDAWRIIQPDDGLRFAAKLFAEDGEE